MTLTRRIALSVAGGLAALILVFFAAVFWPQREAPLPEGPDDRLLTDVRIVDVEAGNVGSAADVRIVDGTIAQIGADLAPRPSETVLDGGGGYLVPGFWDMHMHSFQLSPQLHLPLFVANGITSVRDMMDCPSVSDALIACVADKRRWSAAAAAGEMASPRFMSVASFYFNDQAMSADEAVARAKSYGERGIDAFKMYNGVSRAAYFALAEHAREAGTPLVGHLPQAVSLDEAIAAGQRSFEHAHVLIRHCFADARGWREGAYEGADPVGTVERLVTEQDPARCSAATESLRNADAWLVPTHVTREDDARAADPAFLADPRLAYLDPLSRFALGDDLSATAARFPGRRGQQALRRYFDLGLELTREAHRAGVPILVGTDTAIGGFRYHDELAHLVDAGLSPADVLRSATIEAARYAGAQDRFGTVEVGKAADLVLLEANPLDDIANVRRIRAVLLAGRLYDRGGMDELLRYTRKEARSPANWAKLIWGFVTSDVSSEL